MSLKMNTNHKTFCLSFYGLVRASVIKYKALFWETFQKWTFVMLAQIAHFTFILRQ